MEFEIKQTQFRFLGSLYRVSHTGGSGLIEIDIMIKNPWYKFALLGKPEYKWARLFIGHPEVIDKCLEIWRNADSERKEHIQRLNKIIGG